MTYTRLPAKRTRPRMMPPKEGAPIVCRPHLRFVKGHCCLAAGKVSKITGRPHECEGPIDAHHSPTVGAGGGDNNTSSVCRGLHNRLGSPGHSEKSVEAEYGISFRASGAEFWRVSPARRVYERKLQSQN